MSEVRKYDPRVVANAMLDIGDRLGLRITHLALQKILYFAHGLHVVQNKSPLVSGYFEAWENGPVHPTVYKAFKDGGRRPLDFRAKGLNIQTGNEIELPLLDDQLVLAHITRVVSFYGPLPAGRLVTISHAHRGPWWQTVNKARTSLALGMRITDDVTGEWFRFQNVSIVDPTEVNEVHEDTPFAANRSGSHRSAPH